VVCVAATALVLVSASVAVTGVGLQSPSTPPDFPGGFVTSVLLYAQSQSNGSGLKEQFSVPPSSDYFGIKLLIVVQMSLSCGSSSYLGATDSCSMELQYAYSNGPLGLLFWRASWSGYVASNASVVEAPAICILLINVHAGTPPIAVVSVPFSITVEVATLS
jgi:hypothetical protein